MIQNINDLYGYKLSATDGEIGKIKDFYFDDQAWVIRYLVAETGSWLTGRQVLLTPHAFGPFDQVGKVLPVHLTREQIEKCPSIDQHQPISRQYERDYYQYYGWPYYWDGDSLWGNGAYPTVTDIQAWAMTNTSRYKSRQDHHLRSMREVTGYTIHTVDGEIGKVSGILVDDTHWVITELIVETGHWYAGKKIRLLPEHIERINYVDSAVQVNLTKEDLLKTAKGGVAHLAKRAN